MGTKKTQENPAFAPPRTAAWRSWVVTAVVMLWLGQILWLVWHLRGEGGDLAQRLGRGSWGEAVRLEQPLYRWILQVQRLLPPEATYFFLDNYEAGKEIEVRYHLFPRQHILVSPDTQPSRLFHLLRQHQPAYVLVRDPQLASGFGLKAAMEAGAVVPLNSPSPGLVFAVQPTLITRGFYD
ncbi:MAG: hypothetical protein ACUVXF_10685 [Desulfobaccales bacterium]